MTDIIETPLNMSDEDLANFDWDKFIAEDDSSNPSQTGVETEVDSEESKESTEVEVDDDDNETDTLDKEVITSPESSDGADKEDEPGETSPTSLPDSETEGLEANAERPEVDELGKDVQSEEEVKKEEEIKELDYKEEYNKVFAPFKANGKMMQIESVDDVRTLMQMGANYNKKMAALKPTLKIVKMLENHDLLDEDKLNRLIDLDKKDPEAIKQLIKDSKLDLDSFDPDAEVNYTPKTYTVNDKQVELDSTLESIRDTKSYATTLNIISNKWDASSRKAIVDSPSIIPVINDHIETGIYQQVMEVVDRERMLGRLQGLSDIEAYKVTGDALDAAGKFKSVSNGKPANSTSTATKTTVVDPKLKDKKRAASSTRSSTKGGAVPEFNPLNMSDEEFEKQGLQKYL